MTKRQTEERLYFRVRVPKSIADEIADRAYVQRLSVSQMVTDLLAQAIGHAQPAHKPQPEGGSRAAGTRAVTGRSGRPLQQLTVEAHKEAQAAIEKLQAILTQYEGRKI